MNTTSHRTWCTRTSTGIEIAAETFGEAPHPAVILISGAGAPGAFWPVDFCQRLAKEGLQIVRFDHRDTGQSTHLTEPYMLSDILSDLQHLVSLLDTHQVCLAGHSMGGYLVNMALTDTNFDDVAAGVVISAGATNHIERYREFNMSKVAEETWQTLLKNLPVGDFSKDLSGWLDSWHFLHGERPLDLTRATEYTAALYSGDPRNAQVAEHHIHAVATLPGDLPERLENLTKPLLVLHGSEDPLVPIDHGRALASLVENADFHLLAGAGHMFFDGETWRELGDEILRFLKRLP